MQQHFRPASPADARRVITAQASRRTLVVYFTKRTDGSERRMVCRYFPEAADRIHLKFNPADRDLLPVWDMERGARRFISLDRVEEVVWDEPEAAQPVDRTTDREAARRAVERMKAEFDEIF